MKPRILSTARRSLPLATAIAAMLAVSSGHSATLTWDDGAATGNWNTTDLNWTGVAWNNATPDDAVFGATGVGTISLTEAITAGTLTFNTAGYIIDTTTFGLTLNTGITANEDATLQNGVGGSILFGANNTWSVATDKTLTASAVIGGGFALTKTGAGTLILSGASTYSGGTNINAGTARIGADSISDSVGPLGSGVGNVTLANVAGATLDVNGYDVRVKSLTGGGTTGGNVTLGDGTLRILNPAFGGGYNGVISGTGDVWVTGSSGLNFGGANTYTGTTTLNANVTLGLNHVNALGVTPGVNGTSEIIFNNTAQIRPRINGVIINAPITVNAASTAYLQAPDNNPGGGVPTTVTLNGAIGGAGNAAFVSRLNANSLNTVLLGAASNYAGTTLLDTSGGTAAQIIVKLGVANALPTTTVVTIDGQAGVGSGRFAEINLNGYNQSLAGLTNTARTDRLQRVVNSNLSTAAVLTINGSTNTTFSGNLGSDSPNGSVSATAMGVGAANGNNFSLVKNGSGTFTLSSANTYSGGTTISGGSLAANHSQALGTGGVGVAAGGKLFLNANSLSIANNITLNGTTTNGAIYSGDRPAGNVNTLSGTITLNATSNISSWWNDKTLRLSGQITGSGGLNFVLQPGSVGGRYHLTGSSNDYLGATSVTGRSADLFGYTGQAMLYLGATNALPTTTALTLNYADLYLNGQSQTLPSISGTGSFSVRNGSTTVASLSLGAGDTTSTFAGVIKDDGISVTNTAASPTPVIGTVALTKIGAGTLTLTGASTYTGGTSVSDGTLTLNGSLADATMSIASGGTVNGTGSLTYNVDGTTADQVVNGGTMNISNLTVAVNATGAGLTETEYVLVDATGGGSISGAFAGVTGAPGYTLDYDTLNQVKLVLGAPTDPYEIWAGGPGVPFGGDANGDGIKNGMAFLLGAPDKNVNATGLLPKPTEQNNGDLVMEFKMRANRGGATLQVQHSGDVGVGDAWTDPAVTVPDATDTLDGIEFSVTGGPDIYDIIATIPAANAQDGKLFGRLQANP